MSYNIRIIDEIGPKGGAVLAAAGIETTYKLLKRCGTVSGRRTTAEETGYTPSLLLKWAHMADILRISGIGRDYVELLHACGVDSVKELATREAYSLMTAMQHVNGARRLTRQLPTSTQVSRWIEQAKALTPAVFC